uniref:Putative transmembrane and ubiquitin-like domain-containing protein 1 n=1 Tax=Phlebotomus kandelakii TaxID=1109342 RepID=A0A6B2EHR1_9DIPT
MSIIVSISDLVTAICVTLLLSITLVLAWKSTNVREDHLSAAVLVIENSRRRLIERIHQFQYQQPHATGRSTSQQSNHSNATEEVELDDSPAADENHSNTPSSEEENHFNTLSERHERFLSQAEEIIESLEGPDEIIREMDDMTDGIRHRHWRQGEAAPEAREGASSGAPARPSSAPKAPDSDTSAIDNCRNENNENDISEAREAPPEPPLDMRIKLKYLDDVQRTVQGRPTEPIGEFKRRNFSVELAADKLVRLVFNGHVLQPDSKTLQACGLFDNCVVHCLIHKKPSSQASPDNPQPTAVNGDSPGLLQPQRNDRSSDGGGSGFVYASLALLGLGILFSWYCHVQYGYMFSWYSTIGLAIMTMIFLIMIPILVLINREVRANT